MIVKLLTEHHLEVLSLKGGCRGSSKSTHVKKPHCWKSHALAQMVSSYQVILSLTLSLLVLLITSASSLDPDQDQQNVGPDLVPNSLIL